MTRHTTQSRRGFAMLLVLISLAIATILATAYLASRDNSALIGQNVTSGSSAKWAALATLKSGIAVLETETDWRNNHTNGVVFANASLSGATVDLIFMDRITGKPPTDDTTEVEVTATAIVNGIKETVVAHASVPPKSKSPDLDLSEFVVYAIDKLEVKDMSLIARWITSPKSSLGKQILIGTSNKSAGAISLTDYAVALDTVVFALPGSSSMIVSNSGPGTVQVVELPDTVVVPEPPDAGPEPSTGSVSNMSLNGANQTVTGDKVVDRLTLRSGAVLTIRGPATFLAENDVSIESASRIVIEGDVRFVAEKDLKLQKDCAIELQDGATLKLFVGNNLELDSASVNEVGQSSNRDTTGNATWMDPTRVLLYELDDNSPNWKLRNGSVFKGVIYAPKKKFILESASALYGSVVAKWVEVKEGSGIYYDHSLDTGNGYTVFDGAVYDSDGNVYSSIKSLTSLDEALISTVNGILGLLLPKPPPTNSSDPTPRTVKVEYEVVRFSSDLPEWEENASLIGEKPWWWQ